MTSRRKAIATAMLSIYAVPHLVHAQTAARSKDADNPPAPPRLDPSVTLTPVNVTARPGNYKIDRLQSPKFTAPLVETPRTVDVVSQELMRDTAATSLQEAVQRVPGITFLAGEGGSPIADRPVIRGLNSTANLFVDGVRDIGDQTRDVFDVESVEVIKGADAVYAGRGSAGGSINLVSKKAAARDFANAQFTIGTANKFRATVDKNWRVGDEAGFRLNALGESSGVAGRDDAVDYDKWGVSPSLTFGLGEATRVTLDYYHLTDDSMPDYSIPYDQATGLPATETLGVDRDNFYGLTDRDFRHTKTDIGTVIVEHALNDDLRLRNVARVGRSTNAYVTTNPDDSRGDVANGTVFRATKTRYSRTDTFAEQLDLSGRFDTGALNHRFDLGFELSREKREADGYDVTSAVTGAPRNEPCTSELAPALFANGDCTRLDDPDPHDDWRGTVARTHDPTYYRTDVASVYGVDTIELGDHWQVSGGVHYEHYDTEAKTPSEASTEVNSTDDFVDYQVGLVYKPIEHSSVYLSYGTSTTPAPLAGGDADEPAGASNGRRGFSPANTGLEPVETDSYEIGTKWEVFDERLRLTAAVFQLDRENDYIQVGPGDDDYAYAGETRIRGAEFGVSGRITEAWQVFGGYSYLDAELVEGGYQSLEEGEQLPNVPEHSVTLFTEYDLNSSFSVGGGAIYSSRVFGSQSSQPPKRVPSYWRFDAHAGWQASTHTALRLNVLNLTDETYYTKAYAAHYAALGVGRQVLLSIDIHFD